MHAPQPGISRAGVCRASERAARRRSSLLVVAGCEVEPDQAVVRLQAVAETDNAVVAGNAEELVLRTAEAQQVARVEVTREVDTDDAGIPTDADDLVLRAAVAAEQGPQAERVAEQPVAAGERACCGDDQGHAPDEGAHHERAYLHISSFFAVSDEAIVLALTPILGTLNEP